MSNEVTVQTPQTTLTATQVRALLVEVERKEQAAKTLMVKDVQPGQYFKLIQGAHLEPWCQGATRFRLEANQYAYRSGAISPITVLEGESVILVRNFDGEAL